MNKEVNVKIIMEEIKQQIQREGLCDDLPSFEETTKAKNDSVESSLSANVSGMHASWNVPFYFGFEEKGIKKIVKQIIQKCTCFYIKKYSEGVSTFNGYSTRAMNEMMNQIIELQNRVDELEKELRNK